LSPELIAALCEELDEDLQKITTDEGDDLPFAMVLQILRNQRGQINLLEVIKQRVD